LTDGRDVGVVPLGVPLIAGPALITTTIVLVDRHGTVVTLLALVANLVVCGLVLAQAALVERLLGRTGARAVSKIVSLLLAAIGVQLIRQGLGR
jgi:multiple antibiotic resistance protein